MQKNIVLTDYSKIIHKSKIILKEYDLCDYCLGRFFIKNTNTSSSKRLGNKIRNSINSRTQIKCSLCKNLFPSLDFYTKTMQDISSDYEFSTFSVGAILKQSIIERDDKMRSKFNLRGVDSIKTEITKELRNKFTRKTKAKIDHITPDLTFIINFRTEQCHVKTKPLFLYGRYIKNKRGLPQKQKPCQDCKGKGCIFCNNHGIVSFNSIEGKISQFLYKKFETNQVNFTWIGGEDKTGLVRGNGRPFFAKLISPKKRNIRLPKKSDLDEIVIHNLRIIDHIPSGSIPFKTRIKLFVITQKNITSEKLRKLKQLVGIIINYHPTNSKNSKKVIHMLKYAKKSPKSFIIEMKADGGLPIKHLVDGLHVNPNVSDLLGIKCFCEKFDVYQITLSK